MALKDSITSDPAKVFLRDDDFAETVTYYPHTGYGEVATQRDIKAVVVRNQIVALGPDGGEVMVASFEVHVENSASTGISSSEVDTGGDQIGLASRIGGTVKRRSVIHLEEHDTGMLTLTCQ